MEEDNGSAVDEGVVMIVDVVGVLVPDGAVDIAISMGVSRSAEWFYLSKKRAPTVWAAKRLSFSCYLDIFLLLALVLMQVVEQKMKRQRRHSN